MDKIKNTKTLSPSLDIPKFVQHIARTLQFFSDKLTVIAADKLFRTPVKYPKPKREKTMWKSAQKKRVLVEEIGKEIEVLSYGYSPKKVLLVHGWSGRCTQLFMVADKLLEKGFMTISFDAPAHGKSEGKQTLMPEFIASIHQLSKEFGPFEFAVGHSLGGMSLLNAVAEGFQIKKLVTIGSGDTISEIIDDFVANLTLKPRIAKKLKAYYDKNWQMDIDEYSSFNKAKKVTIPTLVVHDTQDGDVAVSCAVNIRRNLQNGSLLLTNGLSHTKILRDKETMNRVVEFLISDS